MLVRLDDVAGEDAASTGNKAATLARLRRAGYPVPPGVVISADALDAGDELSAAVEQGLTNIADIIGPGPWAVRSSSTVEDAEQASFAGQFETMLDVEESGLVDAVRRSWQSRKADRVRAYAGDRTAPMAILIQPMIAADAAGVAFTLDPVSGHRSVVIEAVQGIADRLVSGRATPERWTVSPATIVQAPPGAQVLNEEVAREIAELARRVEDHLGVPQDIEWATAAGKLWLLQARPITTSADRWQTLIPIEVDVPPGRWERDVFHEPVPLSPFGRVLLTKQVLKVLPAVFAEFGILLERGEVAVIGGWIYNRLVPLGAPPPRPGGGKPPAPPRWLLAVLLRLHPGARRRTRAAREALASDLALSVIRRWDGEWRAEHRRDVERALALDLSSLTDESLVAELEHRIATIAHPAHARVAIAYFILVYELAEACRELLGWDTSGMLRLLAGLSTTSTEPARWLAALAADARARPEIRDLLAAVDISTPAKLAAVDAEFDRAFVDYVEATGHRAVRYDVIEPTLAEQPHLLLRLVANQLELEFSPDRVAADAARGRSAAELEAFAALRSHPSGDRERFARALTRAREAYPAWEDRVWWTQSVQTALLRYLALEIGRRLVGRGQLAAPDDVFFLESHEAGATVLDGRRVHDTVRVRRAQRAWAIANPGPPAYGDPISGEPPFKLLPPEARFVNEAVVWGFGQFFGTTAHTGSPSMVTGSPASAGRYSGLVRVVMGEHDFAKIRPGDVVVCPATSPAWSVVFPSIGALVADSGGILSHPAIIAREHGIPAVVGTGNGTTTLRDDELVTVDGTSGIVELAASVAGRLRPAER
jgi:pyruvate,water dikinase